MNRVLITGANGFVGRALCDALRARGIDHVPTARHAGHSGQLVVGNIDATTRWEKYLAGSDVVIHLAARVHVMQDPSGDPLAAFRAMNVDATINLARQAVLCGVKRFVFVSSVKVNGEETTGKPFTAFDVPAPIDPYGISKLEAEQALLVLSESTGLEVVLVRPPLVYGPGVGGNFLRLMRLVEMGIPLPFGAFHHRRSLLALDNLVDMLIVCAGHPAASGQTFMVSDGCDVSLPELLRMLAGAMGRRARIWPLPEKMLAGAAGLLGKSGEASRLLASLQVDIAHTKSTLKWKPVASLQDAVNHTVAHFMHHR